MDTNKLKRTSRSVTLQLEPEELEFARIGGRSVNGGILFNFELMQSIYAEATKELRGYFSRDEWNFLQIVMEGEKPRQAAMMCSKDNLCRIILKAKNVGASNITGVKPQELSAKIQRELNAAHIYAIWMRVLDFYDHKEEFGDRIYEWMEF